MVVAKGKQHVRMTGRRADNGLGIGQWDNALDYFWNNNYWDWYTGLVVEDDLWMFLAFTVEPTKATVYIYDGNDFSMAVNEAEHEPLEDFDVG